MKVAIVGSRGLKVSDLGNYLPANVTEIVSRDAKWINPCAKEYALSREIKLTEYLSEYEKYGKAAPLKRNNKRCFPKFYTDTFSFSFPREH